MTKNNEVYTFLLRSLDGRQQVFGENAIIHYTINWESVLPKKYKSFRVVGYFRTYEDAKNNTANLDYVFVKVSSLSPKLFDTISNGKSNYLCAGRRFVGITANRLFYNLEDDMQGLHVDYPSTNECTISIHEFDGDVVDIGDYFLWIQFHPIE